MGPIMVGRREAFLDRLTFRPVVPAVIGLALLILSLLAQSYSSYILWLELDRRDNWHTELGIDFSSASSWRTDFRPVVSRTHAVKFTLRAPLQDDLAEHKGKDQLLSAAATQRSLTGKEFALSWQIVTREEVVAEGVIRPSILNAWAMKDHAYYQYTCGVPQLKARREYTFAARVEQANPAVNGLSPVLQVHTWGSLKGRVLPVIWRPWHTFLFCGVGIALLLMAYVRHVHDSKLAGR
jgi:hypothetical protein